VLPDEIMEKVDYLGLKENKKWIPISAVTKQNISQLKDLLFIILESKPILAEKK
jgi:GTP-binding protein HflX